MQYFKNCTKFELISPNDILAIDCKTLKELLIDMLGDDTFHQAYQCDYLVKSLISSFKNSNWLKKSKIIGVNPRALGSFINIVKYALTFNENAIHIMPFFETGHQGSLYVQNSWRISDEYLDKELFKDGFDTSKKQLKLTINLLHAMGKAVGFDVLPHVDSFSEIVFLNPKYFEWAKLNNDKSSQLFAPEIDYNKIYLEVEYEIKNFVKNRQPEHNSDIDTLFKKNTSEDERHSIIFGNDPTKWEEIRIALLHHIRSKGYETLPVVEHAPTRPITFEKIIKSSNHNWAQFRVKNKAKDAVILGCVTPYKWYKIDSEGFADTSKPEDEVWDYFINKYKNIQKEFNFDFIRADMAHNQISHSSKNAENLCGREFWKELKHSIQKNSPYFATLAEAFYNTYYIDGYSDMINKDFDVVLGNLNYKFLDQDYINHIKDFIQIYPQHFTFAPCICTFTNDADKKENNIFYQSPLANEIRIFCAYFLELPSYMGMGYELRNLLPKTKSEYSFNYIKKMDKPYKWGKNEEFLSSVFEMREIFAKIKEEISEPMIKLCNTNSVSLAWLYCGKNSIPQYLFCFNLELDKNEVEINLSNNCQNKFLKGLYSNVFSDFDKINFSIPKNNKIKLDNFPIGSCAIFTFT